MTQDKRPNLSERADPSETSVNSGTYLCGDDELLLRETDGYWKNQCELLFKQLERMKQFNAAASHDLKNPLGSIIIASDLIKSSQALGEAQEYAETISRATKWALQLIDRLLDFAQTEYAAKSMRELVNVQVLLQDLCRDFHVLLLQNAGTIQISTNMPFIKGHRLQLQQLFRNLIGNALKYRSEDPPSIRIMAIEESDYWRFEVHDNGIGIDPEKQIYLFEPFQRLNTQQEGTGLGLAICRSVVEQHGGEISVDSQPGRGSCFHFTLAKRVEESV